MRLTLAGFIVALAVAPLSAQFPPTRLKNIKAYPADMKIAP